MRAKFLLNSYYVDWIKSINKVQKEQGGYINVTFDEDYRRYKTYDTGRVLFLADDWLKFNFCINNYERKKVKL